MITKQKILSWSAIAAVLFLMWFFSAIVGYFIIAVMLSLIGEPLVVKLEKIKIWKFHLNRSVSAGITLLLFLLILNGILGIFVPLVISQANTLSKINYTEIGNQLNGTISHIQSYAIQYGIIPQEKSLSIIAQEKLHSLVDIATFSNLLQDIVSYTGSILVGLIAVLFMGFFFLKDDQIVLNILKAITSDNKHEGIYHILTKVKTVLSKYLIGLIIEAFCVMTLVSIGMFIFGVHQPILIGFFFGIMCIIPYIGMIIGLAIAIFLGVTGALVVGSYAILPLIVTIVAICLVVNILDAIILQPYIYSNSVKAHPLEIFLIIMMGGYAFGIVGMIIAVPTYTILKVIAKEFFGDKRIIKELTEEMK
jgi:predicted PurR-regulated permease PerM